MTNKQLDLLGGLSVVIPVLNEGEALKATYQRLVLAIKNADLPSVEILIVDDGSDAAHHHQYAELCSEFQTRVLRQSNQGRYAARVRGLREAKYETVLLLDSRVQLYPDSLRQMKRLCLEPESPQAFVAHVEVDVDRDPVQRIWQVITFAAWWRYMLNPRPILITLRNYDHFPKGTTCLVANKNEVMQAHRGLDRVLIDPKLINDDSTVLRNLVRKSTLGLNPVFRCRYTGRKRSVTKQLRHTFHRGAVFATGHLISKSKYRYVFLLLIIGLAALLTLTVVNQVAALITVVVFWCVLILSSGVLTRSTQNAVAVGAVGPIFAVVFILGVARGLSHTARSQFRRWRNRAIS